MYYSSLKEKSNKFVQFTIDTKEELQRLVDYLAPNEMLRYRGVNESKYTMLTSLQRELQDKTKEEQISYFSHLLGRVKENEKIQSFFCSHGVCPNDISCMALMQHYGLPTPLLDFSVDIRVALSFAAKEVVRSSGGNDIDDYVSLYVLNLKMEKEVAMNMQHILCEGLDSAKQMCCDFYRKYPNFFIDTSILYNLDKFIKWDHIKELEMCYIENQSIAPKVISLLGSTLDISNPNLSRQKGCFLFNLFDGEMPLEDNWNMRAKKASNHSSAQECGVRELPYKGIQTQDKLCCFDIKKEVIMEWGKENAIPQLYDVSKDSDNLSKELQNIQCSLNSGGVSFS